MKRSVFIILACLLSSFAFLPLAYSLPWPPEMDVVYIKFDYTSGNSDDALDIKRNNSTDIQKPEWYPAYNRNEPMAYIKENECFIQARFWIDRTGFNYAGIYADMSGSGIGDVPEQAVNFNDTQYATETMECFGSVPGSVGIRSFSWDWYVTYIDAVEFEEPLWIGTSGDHEYYTVLAAPQSPMSEPWASVLDYACDWASGKSDEPQAVNAITTNAYTNFSKNYDGGGTHAPGTTFHLTSLLASSWADCRDMSATVHVFTRAIGGTQTDVRMINDPNPYVENFKYKSIDPVGNPSWQTRWWNFHQVANYSGVYDACLRLNQSNPRIPTGEDINGSYKTDLFDPVSGSVWVPKTPFIYITVD